MKNIENSRPTADNTSENPLDFFKQKNEELSAENQVLRHTIEEQEAKIKWYEEQLKVNAQKQYGASSEKVSDKQLSMFNEAEIESVKKNEEPDIEQITYDRKKGRSKTRKTYDELPIEEIHYDLSEEEKTCSKCGNLMHVMKTEVRKELKVIPAQVVVVHHKRQSYACRTCEFEGDSNIVTAPMPKPVLPGSMVSPSLLAFIMNKKYSEAMPLYRQEKGFENLGIDISRQNMASWVIKGTNAYLSPLFERMHDFLLREDLIHADETVLSVLDEKDNKKNYMWLYASGDRSSNRIILYDYQKSRASRHAKNFLHGYKGYLQTDGYAGYNGIGEVTHMACMAHARRKFKEALDAAPDSASLGLTKSAQALKYFQKLYAIEKRIATQSNDERYRIRIEQSKPILDQLHSWLSEESKKTLPKSKLGQAFSYTLKLWDKLIIYLEDGRLSIDNNLAERAIKPFVIGRKNFLFSKSPLGATASGIAYSIIETAKANNLLPFQYLTYLFETLPNIDMTHLDELDACLPWSEKLPPSVRKKPKED